MFKKLIGDKAFYKRILTLALPIMLQNGITNLVNMLDNIMVGRLNIASSSGVTIANQLLFVFNLCIFGAISGAGIFGAQFFGKGDQQGVRHTFRFKLMVSILITAVGLGIFLTAGKPLIGLYLKGEAGSADPALVLSEGIDYLRIMLIGLVPWAISQSYAGTLRECNKPILPTVAGSIAVLVNLVFNYILIFGNFGAPALGVKGAAIATVLSRFVELAIIVIWTRASAEKDSFIIGAFRSLYVPMELVKKVSLKSMPLMLNELFWSLGIATVNQCYSSLGIEVVAATNILHTFFNVFAVAYMAVGAAIGIILGQQMGEQKEPKEILANTWKLIAFSVFTSIVLGTAMFFAAFVVPKAYNYPPAVQATATRLLQICAITFALDAYSHASYFAMRAGGKTLITFVFDSGFVWAISVTSAFVLTRFTDLNILYVYAIVQGLNILKCLLGYIFVKRGTWIRNIVV